MVLKKIDKICLSCKHFRPVDEGTGKCRLNRATLDQDEYPLMKHEDSCASWKDAGQQYYIRLGWVKNMQNSGESEIP